jgi:RNA ligase (TIGR02306 family)
MSKHVAEVVRYTRKDHPNAEKLFIAEVKGWVCVVKIEDFEDNYQDLNIDADLGVYIPSDMIAEKDHPLLGWLEGKRIKPIKLRGVFSQGVLLPIKKVVETYRLKKFPEVGDDLTSILQVKRWEPAPDLKGQLKTHAPGAEMPRPEFLDKYTDVENWNNYPDTIPEGEEVIITEKIDGSCSGYALIDGKFYLSSRNRVLRTEPMTVYKPRLKHNRYRKFNRFLTKYGLLKYFGKKEVIPADETIWHKAAIKFDLENKLRAIADHFSAKNVVIYGEVVPTQIRKGTLFGYGYTKEEIGFIAFDIRIDTIPAEYLPQNIVQGICDKLAIPFVPVLYTGPFKKDLLDLRSGKSLLSDKHIREGIVIQPMVPRYTHGLGRVILKKKNEDFLLIE